MSVEEEESNGQNVRKCVAPFCPSNNKDEWPKLFSFPEDRQISQIWLRELGDLKIPHHERFLCEIHFHPSGFKNSPGALALEENAIPCFFLHKNAEKFVKNVCFALLRLHEQNRPFLLKVLCGLKELIQDDNLLSQESVQSTLRKLGIHMVERKLQDQRIAKKRSMLCGLVAQNILLEGVISDCLLCGELTQMEQRELSNSFQDGLSTKLENPI